MASQKVLVVGSSVVDLAFYARSIPAVGETVLGRFAQGLGGKGFNQAVGSAMAGARTGFISAVGADAFAPPFLAKLGKLEVELAIQEVPGEATGAAAISIDEAGRNSIIVALGANAKLEPAFLEKHARMFDDAAVVLLQFESNLEVVESALKLARLRNPGVITVLNPAPALPSVPRAILQMVDYLTPNETELATIAGRPAGTLEEIRSACASLPVRGAVLATLGERGAFFCRPPRDTGTCEDCTTFPAHSVNAVDTAGAGDAFNGAFAAGLVRYAGDWRKAAEFASAAAAISVTRPGTSASMATRQEIERLLARSR